MFQILITVFSAVLSAVLSIMVALLMRQINKRDARAEERQKRLEKGRIAELNYIDSVGTMAHKTARAVHEHNDGNGELSDAIGYYQNCKHGLEGHLREQHAKEL